MLASHKQRAPPRPPGAKAQRENRALHGGQPSHGYSPGLLAQVLPCRLPPLPLPVLHLACLPPPPLGHPRCPAVAQHSTTPSPVALNMPKHLVPPSPPSREQRSCRFVWLSRACTTPSLHTHVPCVCSQHSTCPRTFVLTLPGHHLPCPITLPSLWTSCDVLHRGMSLLPGHSSWAELPLHPSLQRVSLGLHSFPVEGPVLQPGIPQ